MPRADPLWREWESSFIFVLDSRVRGNDNYTGRILWLFCRTVGDILIFPEEREETVLIFLKQTEFMKFVAQGGDH